MKKLFLVISFDEEYINSIEGSLSRNLSDDYKLEFITNLQYFEEYFQTAKSVDVIVSDEKVLPQLMQLQLMGKKYIITETDKIGPEFISKYSGATGIFKQLGVNYLKSAGVESGYKTQIHDVVCVDNPQVKTYSALAIAMQLSRFGRKVLYISADNAQNFLYYMNPSADNNKQSAMAAIAMKALINGETRDVEPMIQKGEFDYVLQFDHFLSAYGITEEIIYSVAEKIQQLEIYDDVILEHFYGFTIGSLARLERSKNIVVLTGQSAYSWASLEMLFRNTRSVEGNSAIVICSDSESKGTIRPEYADNICEVIDGPNLEIKINDIVDSKQFRSTAEALL